MKPMEVYWKLFTSECLEKEELERVLRDSEHRQEAAKKAQKRVQELFTWEKGQQKKLTDLRKEEIENEYKEISHYSCL